MEGYIVSEERLSKLLEDELRLQILDDGDVDNWSNYEDLMVNFSKRSDAYIRENKREFMLFSGDTVSAVRDENKETPPKEDTSPLLYLECACCGRGFRGWQHPERDQGYGICGRIDCATAYGYHTVGRFPGKEGYRALVKSLKTLKGRLK